MKKYTVKRIIHIIQNFGVFENKTLRLLCNIESNANLIKAIMEKDEEKRIFSAEDANTFFGGKQRIWIPVTEKLPEYEAINPITQDAYVYPVTVDFGGVKDLRYYSFWQGHWYNQGPESLDERVIAWMPRPKLYTNERK